MFSNIIQSALNINPSLASTPQDSLNHVVNSGDYMKYVKYALIGIAGLYLLKKFK